jgi:hypothetical protein
MHQILVYVLLSLVILLIGLVLIFQRLYHKKTLDYLFKQLDRLDDGESPTPPAQKDMKIVQSKKKGRVYNPSRDMDRIMRGEHDEIFVE